MKIKQQATAPRPSQRAERQPGLVQLGEAAMSMLTGGATVPPIFRENLKTPPKCQVYTHTFVPAILLLESAPAGILTHLHRAKDARTEARKN